MTAFKPSVRVVLHAVPSSAHTCVGCQSVCRHAAQPGDASKKAKRQRRASAAIETADSILQRLIPALAAALGQHAPHATLQLPEQPPPLPSAAEAAAAPQVQMDVWTVEVLRRVHLACRPIQLAHIGLFLAFQFASGPAIVELVRRRASRMS